MEYRKNDYLNEYISIIENKVFSNTDISKPQKLKKIKGKEEDIIIPTIKNIDILLKYNYSVYHLKIFAKYYKLKVSGTKIQLAKRIYSYIFLSNSIIKIQKIYRNYMQRCYNNLRGSALIKRDLCNNTFDFLTFESLKDIDINQFFSYTDQDNFIYGFDIVSIYNLIYTIKGNSHILNENVKNPYNRNVINPNVIQNIKKIIRLGKIIKCGEINVKIKNVNYDLTSEKSLELKILDIFQNINEMGNYSDSAWFLELDKIKLIRFIRELYDIWNYRSEIDENTKRMICPPNGNPFRTIDIFHLNSETNINKVRKTIVDIMCKFVFSGVNSDSKILGSYYVLSALTLVSENAASSLPWLYNSVCLF